MKGVLSIRGASKVYDPEGSRVVAVDNLDLDIAPGEFCSVVGPSGCGKTTLLNAIAGFDRLTAGTITLDGATIASAGKSRPPSADRIVVFQNGALFPWRSVLWNVTCGPVMQGRETKAKAEERARAFLARVGMQGTEEKFPGELSGGQARRAEIVRAMTIRPRRHSRIIRNDTACQTQTVQVGRYRGRINGRDMRCHDQRMGNEAQNGKPRPRAAYRRGSPARKLKNTAHAKPTLARPGAAVSRELSARRSRKSPCRSAGALKQDEAGTLVPASRLDQ